MSGDVGIPRVELIKVMELIKVRVLRIRAALCSGI